MTVEVDTSRVSYSGAGTTGPFTIPFYFLENADIRVIKVTIADGTEDELTLTTDFTMTGAGEEEGGTLTLVSSLSSLFKLVIFRDPDVLQEADYPRNDRFPAETHEEVVDRLTMIAQRHKSLLERSVRLPDGDTSGTSMVLPGVTSRQSKFLAFDSDGAITVVDGSDGTTGSLAVALAATGANKGAALVGFAQSGIATTAHRASRTVAAKAGEIVTLDDGQGSSSAVQGDGTTDDTVGIQRVLDGGAKVVRGVQGKTYLVSQQGTKTINGTAHRYCLLIPDGVIFDLNGATLKLADSSNAALVLNATAGTTQNTDLGICNGVIDGNQANQTSPGAGDMPCVFLHDVVRPQVYNLRAKNVRQYAGRFLKCDRGFFNNLHCEDSDGDGWSFGISASSQAVTNSFIDNIYAEACVGTYGSLEGNGIIGVLQYCSVGKMEEKDCAGSLKIQDDTKYSNIATLIARGSTNGSANSGVVVQGNSGSSLYPTGVSIGQIVAEGCYGNGLSVTVINSVTIGQYTGANNGGGASATGSDQYDVDIDQSNGNGPNSLQIGSINSDSPETLCLRHTAVGACHFRLGSLHMRNPTGIGAQFAGDSDNRIDVGNVFHEDDAGTPTTTYVVRVTGGCKGKIGRVVTNLSHTTSQLRVGVTSATNFSFEFGEIVTGSTDVLEGVVALTNSSTTTSVTCGHICRANLGGSVYFHPIIAIIPWDSTAAALGNMRTTVTDFGSGTGFTINHASATTGDDVYWKVLGWKVVSAAQA